MQTWHYTDKSEWPPGPWQDEPDKAQWIDATTGLDCLIVRGPVGSLCGYVGVPPGHSLHGRDYEGIHVDVHGGLTFADACQQGDDATICHVPEPGRPHDVWWLSFDCAHAWDFAPGRTQWAGMRDLDEIYRAFEYVRSECANLAAQLAAMDDPGDGQNREH